MKHLPLLCAALALASCSSLWKDGKPAKLQGVRIDVTGVATTLAPTPGAELEEFRIPEPRNTVNWSQAGGNSMHYPQHVALPEKVVRAWTHDIGSGDGKGAAIMHSPVINGGRLFAVDTDARVTALDAKTGKELWRISLPFKEKEQAKLSGGLAVSGNLLFITTAGGEVFALTADGGKKVWNIDLAVPLRAAPTVQGEKLFVMSHDNRTFALSALDGSLQWTHSGMDEGLNVLAASAPAAANGALITPYSSGELYVLRATDGRYIWHDALTSAFMGVDPDSTPTGIAAPPVVADGLIYAAGLNGGLSAYALTNGQRFWKADVQTSQMPWVAGYQIFVVTEKGEMAAINRRDGAIRWVKSLNDDLPKPTAKRLWVGPLLAGGRLIAASSDGLAVSLEPETGKRLAATDLDVRTTLPPIVADGALYFLSDDGKVVCFRAAE
ncbi:MAG: PQQ-binding-like beta-propeller repeat protein [Pseudomonadaceae bacterium]|nr:PQQ-binding-like beta-propeller repeat protein [Pseudomonadaceae bacterium]